jgi:hypothetical protein
MTRVSWGQPGFRGESDDVSVAGDGLPLEAVGPGVGGAVGPGGEGRGDFVGEDDLASLAVEGANGIRDGEVDATCGGRTAK